MGIDRGRNMVHYERQVYDDKKLLYLTTLASICWSGVWELGVELLLSVVAAVVA